MGYNNYYYKADFDKMRVILDEIRTLGHPSKGS